MRTTKKKIAFSKEHKQLSAALDKGLKQVSQKLIAETKKSNGYLVIADKDGNVRKMPATDL